MHVFFPSLSLVSNFGDQMHLIGSKFCHFIIKSVGFSSESLTTNEYKVNHIAEGPINPSLINSLRNKHPASFNLKEHQNRKYVISDPISNSLRDRIGSYREYKKYLKVIELAHEKIFSLANGMNSELFLEKINEINTYINFIELDYKKHNENCLIHDQILELCDIARLNMKEYVDALLQTPKDHIKGSSEISNLKRDRIQLGHICKIEALSLINNFYYPDDSELHVPLFKMGKKTKSIREISKKMGSLQGEVLDREAIFNIAKESNLNPELQVFKSYVEFRYKLVNAIQKNKPSIICYSVSPETSPQYNIDCADRYRGFNEHAGIISDYDPKTDAFKLLYEKEEVSKNYFVNGFLLYLSNASIQLKRNEENYKQLKAIKIKSQKIVNGNKYYKYESVPWWVNESLETNEPSGLGFKGIILTCNKIKID